MDAAVYIVRTGPNEELRYSLRSLHAHFPGTPVYIVGYKPDWVTGTAYLPGNHHHSKPLNVWGNLQLAANWDNVPENIVIFNDDIYILEPVPHIPTLYRGSLRAHIESLHNRTDWWTDSLERTAALLNDDALSYELHTPFPCQRTLMADTLNRDPGDNPPQWRTLYGNQWGIGGDQAPDVKLTPQHPSIPNGPFASTSDASFRWAKEQLRLRFRHPSPFEA